MEAASWKSRSSVSIKYVERWRYTIDPLRVQSEINNWVLKEKRLSAGVWATLNCYQHGNKWIIGWFHKSPLTGLDDIWGHHISIHFLQKASFWSMIPISKYKNMLCVWLVLWKENIFTYLYSWDVCQSRENKYSWHQ